MWVLITYDVNTESSDGRRRLRRVAKTCESYGQRVQKSVFEAQVDDGTWAEFRGRLLREYDVSQDSLRFYFLGEDGPRRIEHHGRDQSRDMEGPLIL
ncbi:MAG: CRISPR-associated endonuclease Cas2 [Deltaproteobacteria bacterium]|nr:CRISPR-associated endonuclease Cas2 [Deltaproteobacteria bacterium]